MQTWRWFYVVLIGVTVALLSMVVNLGIAGLNSLKIKTTERFITGPGAPHLSLRDFLCVHSDRSNSSAVRPSQVVISIQQTWSCPSVHVIPYVVQLHEHVWHCTGVCQLLCGKHMLSCRRLGGSLCWGLHQLLLMPALACRGLLAAVLPVRGAVCSLRSRCCKHRCVLGSRGCRLWHVRDQGGLQPLIVWLTDAPETPPFQQYSL